MPQAPHPQNNPQPYQPTPQPPQWTQYPMIQPVPPKRVSFDTQQAIAVVFQVFSAIGFVLGFILMMSGYETDIAIGTSMSSTSVVVFLLASIWSVLCKIGNSMFDQR